MGTITSTKVHTSRRLSIRRIALWTTIPLLIALLGAVAWLQSDQSTSSRARVLYVSQHNSGKQDGSSWKRSFNNIQSAVVVAEEGDQIWITGGTHVTEAETLVLKNGVSLVGGFAGIEDAATERDGQLTTTLASSKGSLAVVGDGSLEDVAVEGEVAKSLVIVSAAPVNYTLTVEYAGSAVAPADIRLQTNQGTEQATFTAAAAAGLDDSHFVLVERQGLVWVWLETNGQIDTSTTPAGARVIVVDSITPTDTAAVVASKIAFELNRDDAFSSSSSGDAFTVTNTGAGIVGLHDATPGITHASVGDTGFVSPTITVGTCSASLDPAIFTDSQATYSVANDNGETTLTIEAPAVSGTARFIGWKFKDGQRISTSRITDVLISEITRRLPQHRTIVAEYAETTADFVAVIHVDGANGNDTTGDGSSWANAVRTISKALEIEGNQSSPADEIWIRSMNAGTPITYLVADHGTIQRSGDANSVTIKLHEGVRLYGGFVGTETARQQRSFSTIDGRTRLTNETILDAASAARHVITAADDCVIDGFRLQNGFASGPVWPDSRGGGILCQAASPLVVNCTFAGNQAISSTLSGYGGAAYIFLASPEFVNCRFGTRDKADVDISGLTGPATPTIGFGGATFGAASAANLTDGTPRDTTTNGFTSRAADADDAVDDDPYVSITFPVATELTKVQLFVNGAADGNEWAVEYQEAGVWYRAARFLTNTANTYNAAAVIGAGSHTNWRIRQTTYTGATAAVSDLLITQRNDVTGTGLVNFDSDNLINPAIAAGFNSLAADPGNVDVACEVNFGAPTELISWSYDIAGVADGNQWAVEYFDFSEQVWIEVARFTCNQDGGRNGAAWSGAGAHLRWRSRQVTFVGTAQYDDLYLRGIQFGGNYATLRGGAVFIEKESTPTFHDCDFVTNTAGSGDQQDYPDPIPAWYSPGYGGAVYNLGAAPRFFGCTFQANCLAASGDGGAIYNDQTNVYSVSPTVIEDCTFYGNRAMTFVLFEQPLPGPESFGGDIIELRNGFGGAIYNDNSSPTVKNCTFGGSYDWMSNTSTRHGGAIYNTNGSSPSITGTRFERNKASLRAGAVYNQGADSAPVFSSCYFTKNRAAYGGAVYNDEAKPVFNSSTFLGNVAHEQQILRYYYAENVVAGYGSGRAGGSMPAYTGYYGNNHNTSNGDYFAGASGVLESNDAFAVMPSMDNPFPILVPEGSTLPSVVGWFGAKGAAIYNDDANATFNDCLFEQHPLPYELAPNSAEDRWGANAGGVIYSGRALQSYDPTDAVEAEGSGSGTLTLTQCRFYDNAAVEMGGVLYLSADYTSNVSGCEFGDPDDPTRNNTAGPRDSLEDPGNRPEREFYSLSVAADGRSMSSDQLPSLPTELRRGRMVYSRNANGTIYYIGGINSSNQVVDSVYYYVIDDPEAGWQPLRDTVNGGFSRLNTGRIDFGAALAGDYLYAIGGNTTSAATPVYTGTVERMNITTGQWQVLAATVNPGAYAAGVIRWTASNTTYTRMYIAGTGGNYTADNPHGGAITLNADGGPLQNINDNVCMAVSAGPVIHVLYHNNQTDNGQVYYYTRTQNTGYALGNGALNPTLNERFAFSATAAPVAIAGARGAESIQKTVQAQVGGWQTSGSYPGVATREMAAVNGTYLNGNSTVGGTTIWVCGGIGRDKHGQGGTIYNNGGKLTIKTSTFHHNNAGPTVGSTGVGQGGAIYSTGGTLTVEDSCVFFGNYAFNQDYYNEVLGGAICQEGGTINVSGSLFQNNYTESNFTIISTEIPDSYSLGGAICARASSSSVDDCDFYYNETLNPGGGDIICAGGGLYSRSTSLAATLSLFDLNQTPGTGGGIHVEQGSTTLITKCSFQENLAGVGGGLAVSGTGGSITAEDCLFSYNDALTGGGACQYEGPAIVTWGLTTYRCVFDENTAGAGGGVAGGTHHDASILSNAASLGGGGHTTNLHRSVLEYNDAIGGGGCNFSSLYDCIVRYNEATDDGGGALDAGLVYNTIFHHNAAGFNGGAMMNLDDQQPIVIQHVTATQNTARAGGGLAYFEGVDIQVRNSIFWGNTATEATGSFDLINEVLTDDGDPDIQYCCIRGSQAGGMVAGEGNIGTLPEHNPLFFSDGSNPLLPNVNLRLTASSPCIDAGTAAHTQATDIDGKPRTAIPDMGAYETPADEPELKVTGRKIEIEDNDTTPDISDDTHFDFYDANYANGTPASSPVAGDTIMVLDATSSSHDHYYNGYYIVIESGAGAGQTRQITAYNGTTRAIAVDSAWTADLTSGDSIYRIYRPHTFTVHNTGIRTLRLTGSPAVSLTGTHAGDFLVLEQPITSLASGYSTEIVIGFAPSVDGVDERTAVVTIANNDSDESEFDFSISGLAGDLSPEMVVTGTSNIEIRIGDMAADIADGTDFGRVDFRDGTVVHTFAITNAGGATLNLDGDITLQGHADDFTLTQPNTTAVDAGKAVSFEVTFDPTVIGSRTAIITITSDDPDEGTFTFQIAGEGTGPRIVVQGNSQDLINVTDEIIASYPAAINSPAVENMTDFGSVIAATNYQETRYFVVHNSGTENLLLTGSPTVQVFPADASWVVDYDQVSPDFAVLDQPKSSIPIGLSDSFAVCYRPTTAGAHNAVVQIANDDQLYRFRVTGANPAANIPPYGVASASNGGSLGQAITANPGDTITLSASGSYDQDGAIVNYNWQNSAVVSGATFTNHTADVATIITTVDLTGYEPGIYRWRLTVTDDQAATNAAQTADPDDTANEVIVYLGDTLQVTLPSQVSENDGTVQGSVTVPANVGADLTINLSITVSDGGNVVTLPSATAQITAGTRTASFDLEVGDDANTSNETVSVTATAVGYATGQNIQPMTVVDDDAPEIVVMGSDKEIAGDGTNIPRVADNTDIGIVYEGGTSVSKEFVIANLSKADLVLTEYDTDLYVQIGGANAEDFAISVEPDTIIPQNGTTGFRVVFQPVSNLLGVRNATVTIASNDPDESPYVFNIKAYRGADPRINVYGGSLIIDNGEDTPSAAQGTDFGALAVGDSATRTFTIQNVGDGALTLTNSPIIMFQQGNHPEFTLVTEPDKVVSADGTTTFTIRFTPTAVGDRYTWVVMPNSDSTKDPYTFKIQGTGGGDPDIAVSARGDVIASGGTFDFGDLPVNSSTDQVFTISNTGLPGTTLNLTGTIAFEVGGSTAYSVTSQPSATQIGTDTVTFTVNFTPSTDEAHIATLIIPNNDPDENPYRIILTNGVPATADISVSASGTEIATGGTFDFGERTVNSTNNQVFSISNTGVSGTVLNITGPVTFEAGGSSAFTIVAQPSAMQVSTNPVTFTVSFVPTTETAHTATLVIPNDDPDESPYRIVLTGTGGSVGGGTGGSTGGSSVDDSAGSSGCAMGSASIAGWLPMIIAILGMTIVRRRRNR